MSNVFEDNTLQGIYEQCTEGICHYNTKKKYLVDTKAATMKDLECVEKEYKEIYENLNTISEGKYIKILEKIQEDKYENFKELYESYFTNKKKKVREIYDKMTNNGEKCYICGISPVTQLEHIFPKSKFPVLSIHPKNLVPCCNSCNGAKGDKFVEKVNEIPFNYHFEKNKLEKKWYKLSFNKESLVFNTEICNNTITSKLDIARYTNYLSSYNIVKPVRVEASAMVNDVVVVCSKESVVNSSDEEFIAYVEKILELNAMINSSCRVRGLLYDLFKNDCDFREYVKEKIKKVFNDTIYHR